jgi:membrane associated rhomboid family serine protease
MILWRSRHDGLSSILSEIKTVLPKKTFAFFISLVVVTVSIFVLSLITVELTLYVEMPDWVGHVIEVFGFVVSIALGIMTYRKFSKHMIRH